MKKIFTMLILSTILYSQQQVDIPWPSLADSPWPFIRGDMQATGRSKYIGPSTNNVIWRKDMPLGIIYGPVIGYEDLLYMGEEQYSPSGANYFYAVDKNGQNVWTYVTETGFANNVVPIIAIDSTIIFGSASLDVYALHPNGELKWKAENVLWGTPHCYMTLAKNGDLFIPSADTLVIIYPNGSLKEKRTINGLKGRSVIFSTGGDTIFYFTGGGNLYDSGAVNAASLNGTLLWSYKFATHNLGTPLVDNSNNVYVFGTDTNTSNLNYLYCIKANGNLKWRYRIHSTKDYSSPTIDRNGNIIFHAISDATPEGVNIIVSLDHDGSENWTTILPGDFISNIINHGLVCDDDGKIYFGSTYGGNFYCLNSDGTILWTYNLGGLEYDSSPTIGSDGTLYIGTHSGGGGFQVQNLIAFRDTVTSVGEENRIVESYRLEQNYPNPFNSTTNIKYSIPQSGRVTLTIYDIMGRVVAVLLDKYQEAGSYDVIFQPKDLASGIYFYTLNSGNFTSTKKLILLK
jgi:outer membrane protein assembly factor BamB